VKIKKSVGKKHFTKHRNYGLTFTGSNYLSVNLGV